MEEILRQNIFYFMKKQSFRKKYLAPALNISIPKLNRILKNPEGISVRELSLFAKYTSFVEDSPYELLDFLTEDLRK